jgi:hypothetical protein
MAIQFSNDDAPMVETVEENQSLDSDDEEDATTVGSETLMSKYDLVSNVLPRTVFLLTPSAVPFSPKRATKASLTGFVEGVFPVDDQDTWRLRGQSTGTTSL